MTRSSPRPSPSRCRRSRRSRRGCSATTSSGATSRRRGPRPPAIPPTRPTSGRTPTSIVALAAKLKASLLFTIVDAPKWANGGETPEHVPTDPADFGTFCGVVAQRYPTVGPLHDLERAEPRAVPAAAGRGRDRGAARARRPREGLHPRDPRARAATRASRSARSRAAAARVALRRSRSSPATARPAARGPTRSRSTRTSRASRRSSSPPSGPRTVPSRCATSTGSRAC